MQMESCFTHTSEPGKPGLSKAPEALNSINVAFALNEFILSMVDPEVLFISQIHESIIPSPTIGMDDALKAYSTSNNRLQRGSSAIWNNFCIHLAVTFEDAKDDCFSKGSSASFSFYPASAEEAFINFHLSRKRRLPFAEFGNSHPNLVKVSVDSVPVKAGNLSNLRGIQVQ